MGRNRRVKTYKYLRTVALDENQNNVIENYRKKYGVTRSNAIRRFIQVAINKNEAMECYT